MTGMIEELDTRLTTIFRDVFNDESLEATPAMTASAVAEWDRLNHIRPKVSIEKGFGIAFTAEGVARFVNVGQLVDAIDAKTSAQR